MKKIDLAQAVSILANVGVIAGIAFLGAELQQNNELLRAQTRADRELVRREANKRYLENLALVRATLKAQSGDPLSPEEKFLVEQAERATLYDWHYIYREYREGLLDEDALPILGWRAAFSESPAMTNVWGSERAFLDDAFVEWMEQYIVSAR